ncbi:MAG: 2-dehydro-3-deoxygalactonokinase [Pseudomonadota bacterium]
MGEARLIAVDWGTTHVRAWLMDASGELLDQRRSDAGMGRLVGQHDAFGRAFDALLAGWPRLPAIACGMVGARQGWTEATYVEAPTVLTELAGPLVRVRSPEGRELAIVAGVAQTDPPDVMRGEETKLLGLVDQLDPAASAFVLMPGTHTKHATLDGGAIRRFRTVPTGELFAVLGEHSILRASFAADDGLDEAAFADGVRDGSGLAAGELVAALFGLRASGLLRATPASALKGRLSGLLLGAELALVPGDTSVCLVGDGTVVERYVAAFAALQRPRPDVRPGEPLVRRGLMRLAAAAGSLT